VAPLGPTARAHWRQGGWPRRGSRGLGTSSSAFRVVWRTRPWASHRRGSTRGHCTQRGGLTAAWGNSGEQSRANQAIKAKLRAWAGCSPRGEALESRGNDGGAGTRQGDGGGARLCKNCSGERGSGKPDRGAHRRVSRAANDEAKLTEAKDGARARW
jgi:hypothetical protein